MGVKSFLMDPAGSITGNGFGGIGNTIGLNQQPDLTGLKQAQGNAFGLESQLGAERNNFQGQYNPAMGAANLQDLQNAAAGKVPSPADLQLQQQAAKNSAQQFGQAAALQGRNPGQALRMAQQGAIQTQAQTNADLGIQRAQEQAAARNALTGALQGYRGQDITAQGNLLSGQVGALGAGTTAASNAAAAQAAAMGAQNVLKGGLMQGSGAVIASDERLKTDVKSANLSTLAKAIKGYTFKYKDESNGEGNRVGVMAQDVARGGPAGRAIVRTRGDGKLGLDAPNAIGAALAMSAEALKASRKAA